ncbi:hypothetical protein D3C73_1230280 [compost metagenome]
MYINDILVAQIIVVPYKTVNLRFSKNTIRIFEKQLENLRLFGGQLDLLLIFSNKVVIQIDRHPVQHDHRILLLLRLTPGVQGRSADRRLDPGCDFNQGKRLGNIVIGTEAESQRLIDIAVLGGHNQNGNRAGLPDGLNDLHPVQLGHHNIHNKQIKGFASK